jgi:hypothetical protein
MGPSRRRVPAAQEITFESAFNHLVGPQNSASPGPRPSGLEVDDQTIQRQEGLV